MKITILYQYFQDLTAPGHSSIYEFAKYLAHRNHDVTVVAGDTGYMARKPHLARWYRRLFSKQVSERLLIYRTISHVDRHHSYFFRVLGFIIFSLSCPFGLLRSPKADVVLASSPPLPAVLSGLLVAKLRGSEFVLEVRDLWPDTAVELGILRSRILTRCLRVLENFLYRQSSGIVALTKGIQLRILATLPQEHRSKVVCVPAGMDLTMLYRDRVLGREIRCANGWVDKKVILYFGALGEPQNLNVILRAASRLRHRQDILFVLIGDGYAKATLKHECEKQELINVLIRDAVPKCEANFYLNAAEIGIASLQDIPIFTGAIPTKMLNYMAAGLPVLCGIRGEAKEIVERAQAGVCYDPDDDEMLANRIVDLLADVDGMRIMGGKGIEYVKRNFDAIEKQKELERILYSFVTSDDSAMSTGKV